MYLQSIAGCLDRVLGVARAGEIVNIDQEPTEAEVGVITDCSKPKTEQQSSSDTSPSSAGKDRLPNDQNTDASARGEWSISPTQIGCVFDAIGESAYRDIFNGVRPPANTEVQAAQPCLPGSRSLNNVPHPLGAEQCPSLEILQRNLREYQPRWDQLECHMEGLTRLPLPNFRTSAVARPIVMTKPFGATFCCPEGSTGVVVEDLWSGDLDKLLESSTAESWEQYAGGRYQGSELDKFALLQFTEAEFPTATFTYLPMHNFRPKTTELGVDHSMIMEDYWHDATLRAYAVHVIQRKREGHITQMNLSWGGSKEITTARNPKEFRNWIDEIFIPQKIQEAKIAEKLKMETFKPWITEIDVMVMYQSWALEASDQELLETGQYLLDSVAAAVRPHFKGRLTPKTYAPGSALHSQNPRPIWKELTFKDFDEVGFTFFPHCDLQTSTTDAREQFAIIMEMVERDSIPWAMAEMDIPAGIGWELCGTDIFDQADEILSAILDILFELEIQPMGISTTGHGNIYSKEHKAVIEEKIFSRSAD